MSVNFDYFCDFIVIFDDGPACASEQCQENAKGADLSRSTSKARNLRNSRSERTEEQIQQQNTDARVRMAQLHQEEPEDTRAERNEVRRLEQQQSRRFTVNRRRTNDQQRQQECPHCHALKFKNEPAGMLRVRKVQLPEIETPPEPLNGLLIGTDPDSNVFLKSIRRFNSCFQMTSFGATEIIRNTNANGQEFNSTFKIRGQVYHKMGSLLPMPNEPHKYLQIYFMGGEDSGSALANRVNARCDYNNLDSLYARRIVSELAL
ncbi:ATP-dependent DNA helicase [Trichonephila clavipes]|nr:ATP-dependent DNA helicase [Trichonephila clavipes]